MGSEMCIRDRGQPLRYPLLSLPPGTPTRSAPHHHTRSAAAAGGHLSEVSTRERWYLVWQGTIMHIIRLWVLVRKVGTRGYVDQERLAFSAWEAGRSLRHRQEIH